MYKIVLKKKSVTKTNNHSFNVLIDNITSKKIPFGSYNQNTGILLLDLDSFLVVIAKGVNFSHSFNKIVSTSTGGFAHKKTLKIKF